MADLTRGHQVLISAAACLCLHRFGIDHDRDMKLDIIAEVLPGISAHSDCLGAVVQAARSLIGVRGADREARDRAQSVLNQRLQDLFKERLGGAYDHWRVAECSPQKEG